MLSESLVVTRNELLTRLGDAREETDRVFRSVRPEAMYERPIPERHRIVFYVGHLEAFDWNLLRANLGLKAFHAEFDRLFAFGIDPVDGKVPADQPSDWPRMQQVEAYRDRIREELSAALSNTSDSGELTHLLNISIEHRLMHAETLEYMLHQLPLSAKVPQGGGAYEAQSVPEPGMVQIPAGRVTLGFDGSDGEFGWDNEFDAHVVSVPAFSVDKHKVTNGEFLEFWQAGGYKDRSLWEEKDWEWREKEGVTHPVFWKPEGDDFIFRSMFHEASLPLQAPVFVSYAEAAAYAKWTSKSLPSEAEWQRAAEGSGEPSMTRVLWDSPAVTTSIAKASDFGVEGMIGTGWEWTSSVFAPFTGFKASEAYPGYSADFFDGNHVVMKGGSTRTAACMLRKSFRNWFQPHYQYVYAGFRCVRRD